ALTAEFTVGEGKLMTHDEPCSMAPDDKHDLISGTCSHLPLGGWFVCSFLAIDHIAQSGLSTFKVIYFPRSYLSNIAVRE
ncbi:hypothetical protein L0E62_29335, partial [Klebsiella pneumoniae]|nr:hypothetical protein [Klebsiella pneumoniae]MCF0630739.1 hypothetical protein [Klebsiella pneumoniae]MCF0689937.1 hypothetical protein [Klebsiella pneumoniae]MCF0711902.1 hypothetical protein [Klebsiella pneumoniae]MCF0733997.1 hypothetical protein [Klebsiella pneumoniae]